jgi:hypothetical protein
MLERETAARKQLEHKLEVYLQRVEANEGIDLRPARKADAVVEDEFLEEGSQDEVEEPKRRGRPRKA